MGNEVFDYQRTKQGRLRIFWQGRCIMTLGGERARRAITSLEDAGEEEVQYLLQRLTGNFKRGNEGHKRRQDG